jgi:hypothetical protein
MAIEQLNDILNDIADEFGIYGGHDDELCGYALETTCRCCRISEWNDRIREALIIENDLALASILRTQGNIGRP